MNDIEIHSVRHAFSITDITDYVMAAAGDNAEFSCFVDANPIKEDSIKWERSGFDMAARTISTNVSNAMYLLVKNVSAADSGLFDCVVNNGIGSEVKNSSYLLVRGIIISNFDRWNLYMQLYVRM